MIIKDVEGRELKWVLVHVKKIVEEDVPVSVFEGEDVDTAIEIMKGKTEQTMFWTNPTITWEFTRPADKEVSEQTVPDSTPTEQKPEEKPNPQPLDKERDFEFKPEQEQKQKRRERIKKNE